MSGRAAGFGCWLAAALFALAAGAGWADPACPEGDYPAQYTDPAPFLAALADTGGIGPAPAPVSGVVVPHHLVVPEMIAGGLRLASGQQPRRILLLHPDHFNASPRPFATSGRGFASVLGPVPGDPEGAAALLAQGDLVAASCLFGKEHAVGALLPFLARLFPGVPVLPVAVANNSARADWERMADLLAPLAGPGTLIVQSTDFSHYLPAWQARLHDQQVLNLLAAEDADGIAGLVQPDHVDSVGAAWLTLVLERRLHGAAPLVIANRNQQDLSKSFLLETTSYMVILYQPPASEPPAPWPGTARLALAGDVFLGRTWPRLLWDELIARRVETAALAATRGLPLVANLEGVLLPEMPGTLPHMTLAMPADLLADWAGRLHVAGFGLANNHARDIGASGVAETLAALEAAAIPHAGPGERLDLPGVTLVMLSDLDGEDRPRTGLLDDAALDRLIVPDASVPVVAFVHWGEEWITAPGPRERDLIARIAARGVAAIVGAHPHAASAAPVATPGGDTLVLYSLGNFLFDQTAPQASGALAEITSFAQGTLFLRQLPAPPLFNIALGRP